MTDPRHRRYLSLRDPDGPPSEWPDVQTQARADALRACRECQHRWRLVDQAAAYAEREEARRVERATREPGVIAIRWA